MFNAIIKAGTLQSALKSVGVLVSECKIQLGEDGLQIRAVDEANVGMVDLFLGRSTFESFETDGGVLGVDLGRLSDTVGMANSDQLIHFDLDEETRKLHLSVDGLEYTLALIDPESIRQEPDIPALDLPANVVMEGRHLDRAVTASDMVSNHIALGVDPDEEVFYVDAEGDTDDVHLELQAEDLIDVTFGNAYSMYSLDYLKSLNKAIGSDMEVELELGEEFPTKIHYTLSEIGGEVTYMLAPRIQSQ